MVNKIKELIKLVLEKIRVHGILKFLRLLSYELIQRPFLNLFFNTYSQLGEDIVIDNLLGKKKVGFYVDIGAYDPLRFSNTKRFYNKGWKGINIEPDYNSYQRFLDKRKRDINLNIGIGENPSEMIFYSFRSKPISTFSKESAELFKGYGYVIEKELPVRIDRLDNVLSKHLNGKSVDFLSIDVEGLDLEVLKSNNWDKFRPTLICVECIRHSPDEVVIDSVENEMESFFKKIDYEKVYRNDMNSIFMDKINKKQGNRKF